MIESTRILTGSPGELEPQVNQYLASHPNATVLATSVHALPAPEPPATKTPNSKSKTTHPPTPIITVCVIVGIKL